VKRVDNDNSEALLLLVVGWGRDVGTTIYIKSGRPGCALVSKHLIFESLLC
jgi:hypothetical protein